MGYRCSPHKGEINEHNRGRGKAPDPEDNKAKTETE